jgi:hypothetical protein
VKIGISSAQLDALEAAKRGQLTRPDTKHEHWRLANGAAVTATARTLLARGFILEGTASGGHIPAVITEHGQAVLDEHGQAVLDELASREPAKETNDG